MMVARPKNAAPPKKMENCLRDRGPKIDWDESGGGADGWEEVESDMALSGEFRRNSIPLKWPLKPMEERECNNIYVWLSVERSNVSLKLLVFAHLANATYCRVTN